MMYIKIHRGTKQIGGNVIEVGSGDTKIILDCGANLPASDGKKAEDTFTLDGLTRGGESTFDGVFITHYHNDHCGLMGRINQDIPIYASAETRTVLGIISDFIDAPPPRISAILEPGKIVNVGSMQILPLNVKHSAYGALMLLISAEGKKVLYTGDFNHIDPAYYMLIGKIDLLICEGTNISGKNGLTEADICSKAVAIMHGTDRPVFVLTSTTNIDRIKNIDCACWESGRTIATDLFLDAVTSRISRPMHVDPVGFMPRYIDEKKEPRIYKYLNENNNYRHYCKTAEIAKMTGLTIMVRDTMGAFIKALDKASSLKGSTLIYSMWDGYKTKPRIKGFLSLCGALGINIIDLHASGHVYRDRLQETITRLNPNILVPVHTESPEGFASMHNKIVLPDDSEIITL